MAVPKHIDANIKATSQMTRVEIVKITCQESESIHPPKLVKHFYWYIDSDFYADQLMTRIIFFECRVEHTCRYQSFTFYEPSKLIT